MTPEAKFQSKIVKHLRSKGFWVMKLKPGFGVPAGTADIFFCKEGFYGWLEVKASKKAKKQPGQEAFIAKMAAWSYARFVYPENWEEIKAEIDQFS